MMWKTGDKVRRKDDPTLIGIVRMIEETPSLTVKVWLHVEYPPTRGLHTYDARLWELYE